MSDSPSSTWTASAAPPAAAGLRNTMAPLACQRCQASYDDTAGYLDFAPTVAMKPGLGPFYLQDPLHVPRYEAVTRAAFLNIMGQNWRGALCADDEDAYIHEHLGAVDGPVLDVGCGAGRHFQLRHEATFNVRSFSPAEIATWLDAADLDLADLTGPAGTLLFTARKRA